MYLISFFSVFGQKVVENDLLWNFCLRKLTFFRQFTLKNVYLNIGLPINLVWNRLIFIKQANGQKMCIKSLKSHLNCLLMDPYPPNLERGIDLEYQAACLVSIKCLKVALFLGMFSSFNIIWRNHIFIVKYAVFGFESQESSIY